MGISVKGKPGARGLTPSEVKKVARYTLKKLFRNKRRLASLSITIVYDARMPARINGDHVAIDDGPYHEMHEVAISSRLSKKNMIRTVCHEMVHVAQQATGRMRYSWHSNITYWHNKQYNNVVEHSELPWEQEAYLIEDILFDELLDEVNHETA